MQRVTALQEQLRCDGADVRMINFQHGGPLNTLGHAARVQLLADLAAAIADPRVRCIAIAGSPTAFSAGADINEFSEAAMKAPYLTEMVEAVDGCPKPVVALISGPCLGGGLEVALACDVRVASSGATFGFPEVKIGLVPGAGGTQRAPRAVGLANAVDLCCSGRTISAATALRMRLIDDCVEAGTTGPPDAALLSAALAVLNSRPAKNCGKRRLSTNSGAMPGWCTAQATLAIARHKLAATVPKGFTAPFLALDAVGFAAAAPSFARGLHEERRIFRNLALGAESAALKYLFLASRRSGRVQGPLQGAHALIRHVGVVGGGFMGSGIAAAFLMAGFSVTVVETTADARHACAAAVSKVLSAAAAKGKMSTAAMLRAMGGFTAVVSDFGVLRDCGLVVEAVFEDPPLKRAVFARLDAACREGCLLATNTSTLDIDAMAAATKRPELVVGLHFFSPAHVMPLLEIVRGRATSPATVVLALSLGKALKKTCVVVGNTFGFVANRLMLRAGHAALCMVEEGAQPKDVDGVVRAFGFPMGPFAMQDMVGIDVGARVRQHMPPAFAPSRDANTLPDALQKMGRRGQKSGRGWYHYEAAAPRTPVTDLAVERLVLETSRRKGIARRTLLPLEVRERYLFTMINEAARLLEEGVAARPSDIDVVMVYGFGFPFFKGGLLYHADTIGVGYVVERLRVYAAALGPGTCPPPCSLLSAMAAEGKCFSEMNA